MIPARAEAAKSTKTAAENKITVAFKKKGLIT